MHLLIPAAGIGKRMGGERNKLLRLLLGKPLLAWTLAATEAAQSIHWIGIMSQPEDWPDWQALVNDLSLTKPVEFIPGGRTRQESVYNGLQALPTGAEQVLIHDGARCLATTELIDRCAEAMDHYSGLIAAVPVKDTIKQIDTTVERYRRWRRRRVRAAFRADRTGRYCPRNGSPAIAGSK